MIRQYRKYRLRFGIFIVHIDDNITPFLSPSVLVEEFEGEFVIHLPDTAKTYLVDPIMALLLSHCDGKNNITHIIDILTEMYPERSQQVSEDVPRVIKEMLEAGVLKV